MFPKWKTTWWCLQNLLHSDSPAAVCGLQSGDWQRWPVWGLHQRNHDMQRTALSSELRDDTLEWDFDVKWCGIGACNILPSVLKLRSGSSWKCLKFFEGREVRQLSIWGVQSEEWTPCKRCCNGTQTKTRKVNTPAAFGGAECGATTEEQRSKDSALSLTQKTTLSFWKHSYSVKFAFLFLWHLSSGVIIFHSRSWNRAWLL